MKSCDRKALVEGIIEEENISVSRACNIVCLARSQYYYQSTRDDSEVIAKLEELARTKANRGFDNYYARIRNDGLVWNRKRVLRVYRLMKLTKRRKYKRRLPMREKRTLAVPSEPNNTWSMDFMSDSLINGRKFRVFNVLDDFNREALINEAYYSIPAKRVTKILSDLIRERGCPARIRVDNGPEFTSHNFVTFCKYQNIELQFIQPGKPAQNGYVERFNRTFREDVLVAFLFENLTEVNEKSFEWQIEYNDNHPHQALNGRSPWKYKHEEGLRTNEPILIL